MCRWKNNGGSCELGTTLLGGPQDLFQASVHAQVAGSELVTDDVAKNGQRFLINTQIQSPKSEPLSVILNWPAAFKK